MRIVVLHNEASEEAAVDEQDVIVQRDAIAAALRERGHDVATLGCTLDLRTAKARLSKSSPDVVFNLVESLGGTDRLACLASLLLDSLGIPYTGAPTDATLATSNKVVAKSRMREAGLPTPDWLGGGDVALPEPLNDRRSFILKPVWEHASVGMDDAAVVSAPVNQVAEMVLERSAIAGRQYFAEQFIDGREFNLSVLGGPNGPEPLPQAEIDFSAFPSGKPRIVGYRAKWDAASFEYHQTPRRFDFPTGDQPLLDRLAELSRACWELFALRGYARVDFRVDQHSEPWILEVNTNPCLSPDAGFAAALAQAGIAYDDAVERIVSDAIGSSPRVRPVGTRVAK